MKEIDDTPLNKSESENLEDWISGLQVEFGQITTRLRRRIQILELRIANLETRKVIDAQRNEDEEWY